MQCRGAGRVLWPALEVQAKPLLHLLVQIALQLRRVALGGDAAGAQHADPIRHSHDPAHVVIDQQDARLRRRELLDPDEHLFDDVGREPDARLVDGAQRRLLQPGLREFELLLLAA